MPWFLNVKVNPQPVIVPASMPETVARLLREGWAEVPDPRVMPAPSADAEPDTEAQAIPSAPVAPIIAPYVDTDPQATAARQQEQQHEHVQTVRKRNTSAREWIERKG